MKQQKDWFTGIDYYGGIKEKEIYVEAYEIDQPIELHAHVQVELWYVLSGSASIEINGMEYALKEDSCMCLYSHHLYRVHDIKNPLKVIVVKFFIGLFMHMMWEKHSPGKNAELVYETHPVIDGSIDSRLKSLFSDVYHEKCSPEFGSRNMIMYQVLEIHMLHCRYALKKADKVVVNDVWNLIQNMIVSPSSDFSAEESARTLGYHPNYLNQKIKNMTGMSFAELRQFSKMLNACALLHFEELDISYIVEQLGCTSKASFYRIFEKYTGMSPLNYRKENILDTSNFYRNQEDFLKILQYIFLNFSSEINVISCSAFLHVKVNFVETLLQEYGYTFFQLLEDVRHLYARILLQSTLLSITTIALDCGYGSASNFLRTFSKQENCTPSEYRQMYSNIHK